MLSCSGKYPKRLVFMSCTFFHTIRISYPMAWNYYDPQPGELNCGQLVFACLGKPALVVHAIG